MEALYDYLSQAKLVYLNSYIGLLRYAAPLIAAFLLWRCLKPLLFFKREPEIWAWLCMEDGKKLPVTHWENVIGRHKRSDIVIDVPTVSRSHGVLTRYDDGSWTITDSDSSNGILVNGKKVNIPSYEVKAGDVIAVKEKSASSPKFKEIINSQESYPEA